jgi:hypothetical protein
MKKEVKDALNTLKTFLGMEVKLEQMMLVDGVTTIEFDILEAGQPVTIVNEEDRIPLPIGEYELQDGQILKVLEDGIIGEIGAKQEEEEAPEVEEEVEMEVEKPVAKKVVESTVKETHFSKEEKENLEKEIEELKAKITELSKVEEVVELSEEEVKPISFNPENKQQIEVVKLGKGKSNISNILEKVYK